MINKWKLQHMLVFRYLYLFCALNETENPLDPLSRSESDQYQIGFSQKEKKTIAQTHFSDWLVLEHNSNILPPVKVSRWPLRHVPVGCVQWKGVSFSRDRRATRAGNRRAKDL